MHLAQDWISDMHLAHGDGVWGKHFAQCDRVSDVHLVHG